MPRRKRRQEWKRRFRVAEAEVEAQVEQDLRLALAGPLDDLFWREHERGDWCCVDCDPHHPDIPLAAADQEIKDYLARTHD